MGLSDKINDKFEQWAQDVSRGIGGFVGKVIAAGMEGFQHRMGIVFKPLVLPALRDWSQDPDCPPYMKTALDRWIHEDGEWQGMLASSLGGTAIGGAASAAMSPWLEALKRNKASKFPFMNLDMPLALSALLRGEIDDETYTSELKHLGWHDWQTVLFKELVHLRLDPDIVQRIWLRNKEAYEKLWTDLHDVGWDAERIGIFKELAYIIPSPTDLIRMAVREVFTPAIVEKYGQMEDFPPDFAKWGEKVGLTEEWAKNYWAAHWDLPSARQGFEMLHRGVITRDDLMVLLRALDVMPYWRDKLTKIAYNPYTRVDVRRMYKLGILDLEGVKRSYLDLGYDEEHAQGMTDFTREYYAAPSDEAIDKERDLTRSDITTGYHRGLIPADEATELLDELGYTPDEITYYLSREDLKVIQDRKDAYASNYRQLYVTGLIDDTVVSHDLVELGFMGAEVTELLQLWYIERVRRIERPSRSDLGRFYKKEIITLERYQAEMAALGWSDDYIALYLKDMED